MGHLNKESIEKMLREAIPHLIDKSDDTIVIKNSLSDDQTEIDEEILESILNYIADVSKNEGFRKIIIKNLNDLVYNIFENIEIYVESEKEEGSQDVSVVTFSLDDFVMAILESI